MVHKYSLEKQTGIHDVKGDAERVIVDYAWSIEVPKGFSYCADIEATAHGMDGDAYLLQIQQTEDKDFSEGYMSEISLVVTNNCLKSNYYTDNLLQNESLFDFFEEVAFALGDPVFLKKDKNIFVSYSKPSPSFDEGFDNYSFNVLCAGKTLIYNGHIQFDNTIFDETDQKTIIEELFNSIEPVLPSELAKNDKYSILPSKYRLDFSKEKYVYFDNNIQIPIPEGYEDTIIEENDKTLICVAPKGFSIKENLDPTATTMAFSIMSSIELEYNYEEAISIIDRFIDMLGGTNFYFSKRYPIFCSKFNRNGLIINEYITNTPCTKNTNPFIIFTGSKIYVGYISATYDSAISDNPDTQWDAMLFTNAWLSRIFFNGEKIESKSFLTHPSSRKDAIESDEKEYDYSDDFRIVDGVLEKYYGVDTNVVIPNGVISIGNMAFIFCENLKNIVIPDGVTSIGDDVFSSCKNLESITIPNGVTSIGNGAFSSCSQLENITIPNSVINIGNNAFVFCKNLKSIIIPDGVTSIGDEAFLGCKNLESITIPNGVTSIGDGAFCSCSQLKSITIPNGVTNIGKKVFGFCKKLNIVIPDGVTNIDDEAFYFRSGLVIHCNENSYACKYARKKKIAYITEDGVRHNSNEKAKKTPKANDSCDKSLSSDEFIIENGILKKYNGSEKNIIIPDDVKVIGSGAFKNYSQLESIVIPEGVISIEEIAFRGCAGLKSITIPDSVTNIGRKAFHKCKLLKSIVIPRGVVKIEKMAFYECNSLTDISVSSENSIYDSRDNCNAIIETKSDRLVIGCKGTIIPNSVKIIGNSAFYGCNGLHNLKLPNSVNAIEEDAFRCCIGLKTIDFSNSLKSIDDCAFYRCSNLKNIIIPDSVTSIGSAAFFLCKSLEQATILNDEIQLSWSIFIDTDVTIIANINSNSYKYAAEYEHKFVPLNEESVISADDVYSPEVAESEESHVDVDEDSYEIDLSTDDSKLDNLNNALEKTLNIIDETKKNIEVMQEKNS